MKNINFSYNWNNKLGCKSFTTLRLHNPKKYIIGEMYSINLKKSKEYEHIGIGSIIDIKNTRLHKLNEYIARLDTGYSAQECMKTIRKMYPKVTDWLNQPISIILIQLNNPKK